MDNKYLTKIAEIADREGGYGSSSSVISNRYLEKIAEQHGLEKQAWVPLVVGAARLGMAAYRAAPAIGRGLKAGYDAFKASRASRVLHNTPLPRNPNPNATSRAGLRQNAANWSNAHRGGSSTMGPRESTLGMMRRLPGQMTQGLRNPLSGAVGRASSAASGAINAARNSRIGRVATSPGAQKAMNVMNTGSNAVGIGMMAKDMVSGGSAAAQTATQASTNASQRAMTAATPRPAGGGWGGENPGWNMQGAGAF